MAESRAEQWPLAPLPAIAELEAEIAVLEERLTQPDTSPVKWRSVHHRSFLAWAHEALAALSNGGGETARRIEHTAWNVGGARFLFCPGEPFGAIGRAIRSEYGDCLLFPTGLANGCEGYIPTPDAFDRDEYEATGLPRFLGLQGWDREVSNHLLDSWRKMMFILRREGESVRNREIEHPISSNARNIQFPSEE
jgi:hypothetical protein